MPIVSSSPLTDCKSFMSLKLAATGPRKLTGSEARWVRHELKNWLKSAVERHDLKNVEAFSGMALGVDTIWAEVALEVGVTLRSFIPFEHQHGWARGKSGIWMELHDRAWSRPDRDRFESLLFMASSVIDCSATFDGMQIPGRLLHHRNTCMAGECDCLGAVWHEVQRGGTWHCLSYTLTLEKPVYGMNLRTRISDWNSWTTEALGLV